MFVETIAVKAISFSSSPLLSFFETGSHFVAQPSLQPAI